MLEKVFPSISLHYARLHRQLAEEIAARNAAEKLERIMAETMPAFARDNDEDEWGTPTAVREPLGYTENDIAQMNVTSLELSYHAGGRGLLKAMQYFVLGEGCKVIAADENPEVQKYWEGWCKYNKWDVRRKESFRRYLRDTDLFLRWFPPDKVAEDGHKYLLLRFVEPNEICNPANTNNWGHWSFGIETNPDDIEEEIAFYRCYQYTEKGAATSTQKWERIVAEPDGGSWMDHFKGMVDSNVKRGRSWLVGSGKYIRMHERWLDKRFQLNELRTLFAVVENVKGVGGSSLTDLSNKFADTTGKTKSGEGTPKKMPSNALWLRTKGIDYDLKSLNLNASDAAEDGRNFQLMICAATGLTEYVVRGDSSNANFSCHDELTEYMTDRGWVGITEVKPTDRVATMNPDTGLLEFQLPTAIHLSHYEGHMVQAEGAHNINFCVTPNHRMYVRKQKFERKGGRKGKLKVCGYQPWKFVLASDLNGYKYNVVNHVAGFRGEKPDYFILPGIDRGQYPRRVDRCIPMDLWLEFLGYFISAGWIVDTTKKRWNIGLCQKKGPTADQIRACLKKMPLKWQESGPGAHDMIRWQLYDKALWHWIKDNIGSGALNKRIPQFVQRLDSSMLGILLNALVDGDRSRRDTAAKGTTMYYYTASRQLADDVLMLALKVGYDASIQAKMRNPTHGVWPVVIKPPRPVRLYPKRHCAAVEYSGLVGCVTVPNGLIITRRNGKISIHGNSTMVSESPMVKMFQEFQDIWRHIEQMVYRRVIRWAIDHEELDAESWKTREGQLRLAQRRLRAALREGRVQRAESILAEIDDMQKDQRDDGNSTDQGDKTPMSQLAPPKVPILPKPEPQKEKVPTSTDCQVEFPPLIHRDILQETQALTLHQNNKWASRETCAATMGYDPAKELEKIQRDEAQATQAARQADQDNWS